MDIRTNYPITPGTISSVHPQKIGGGQEEIVLSGDSFVTAERTESLQKPSFSNLRISTPEERLESLRSVGMGTGMQAAALSISPVIKSFPGAVAKWLISDEQEKMIGEMLENVISSEFKISDDPALNARVQNLGNKIAEETKRPGLDFSFKVIDDDTVNAFAGPGGKVYIHRGLMEAFPEDAHLAFIIGHEVGHVENRDSIDRLGVQFVLGIMQAVLTLTPGKLDNMLSGVAGNLYDAQVSQKAEYEADRRGVDHMNRLGFDPKKGAEALRMMDDMSERKPKLLERLFASHPPSSERAKRAEKYASKL